MRGLRLFANAIATMADPLAAAVRAGDHGVAAVPTRPNKARPLGPSTGLAQH